MLKINFNKIQSINRNKSVDRERVSNACIIGLYVLKGNTVKLKLPTKKAKNTLAHISVSNCKLHGKDIEEVLTEQHFFEQKFEQKNFGRNKEVYILNLLSKEVIGSNYVLAKRTNAIKLMSK